LAGTPRSGVAALWIGLACLACIGLLGAEPRIIPYGRLNLDPVFVRLASASLAILAGAFLATALAAEMRLKAAGGRASSSPVRIEKVGPAGASGGRLAALLGRARRLLSRPVEFPLSLAAGMQALIMLSAAAWALYLLVGQWPLAEEPRPQSAVFFTRGAVALVAAFPLLLAERTYADATRGRLEEASSLQLLLRLALVTFFCEGILSLLEGYGFDIARFIEPLLRGLIFAIAAELGLRAIAVFFQPAPRPEAARAAVSSSIAGLLRPENLRRAAVGRALESELGIDLSRSWALQFLRGALIPVALLLVIFAWGLTGVTILGVDQRGIYERLGRPVSVLQPGLHVGLPYPLGIVRRVDFGEVHRLSLGPVDMQAILGGAVEAGVEAAPPQSADRLWDDSHPTERSYLIASQAGGRSAFEIVDVDVALIWRVGLRDEAALASAYRIADPEILLRAFAGRLLARYFSTRTLLGALGEKREGMSDELRQKLQAALDEAGSGIEIVALVVEAIHPPAKAADSYHEVQAARIRSEAMIAEASRRAVALTGDARRVAIASVAEAQASAAQRLSVARSDALRFASDENAYAAARSPYLFERYLASLTHAFAGASITLLDHRIAGAGGETVIDMRALRGVIPPVPDEDVGEKEPSK
jgi:regulator of protease activity HflC (stomatin/prohibitin superfamily)